MADLAVELAELNSNARDLLKRYDNSFKKLESEANKQVLILKSEVEKGKKSIEEIINNTDLKKIGEEYAEVKVKLKTIDDKFTTLESSLTNKINKTIQNIKTFDYMEVGKPKANTNPNNKYALWLDLSTGVIWVCVDNTKDKNKWVSEKGIIQYQNNKLNNKLNIKNYSPIEYWYPQKQEKGILKNYTLYGELSSRWNWSPLIYTTYNGKKVLRHNTTNNGSNSLIRWNGSISGISSVVIVFIPETGGCSAYGVLTSTSGGSSYGGCYSNVLNGGHKMLLFINNNEHTLYDITDDKTTNTQSYGLKTNNFIGLGHPTHDFLSHTNNNYYLFVGLFSKKLTLNDAKNIARSV